jgi:hypothetical protein
MRELPEIERRIECLCSDLSSEWADACVLAEMGDVLVLGYLWALRADARSRRLSERIDRLLEEFDDPQAADEVRRLARERRAIDVATQRVRLRLGALASLFARLSARSDSASV